MKLGVRIKGVKEREGLIDYELEQLGLKNKKKETVIYCGKTRDIKSLCVEAMKTLGSDVTHALIFDDDVLLCNDILSLLNKSCEKYPDVVFGLCTKTVFCLMDKKIKDRSPYIKFESKINFYGQAFVIPMKYLDDYAYYCEKIIPHIPNSDRALIRFCKDKSIPVMTLYPSLVQHQCPDDSLLGHDHKNIKSSCWLGEEAPKSMNYDSDEYLTI